MNQKYTQVLLFLGQILFHALLEFAKKLLGSHHSLHSDTKAAIGIVFFEFVYQFWTIILCCRHQFNPWMMQALLRRVSLQWVDLQQFGYQILGRRGHLVPVG